MTTDQFQALGGQGSSVNGGNGTLFFKSSAQGLGDLVIDGTALSTPSDSTPLPEGFVFDNLSIINGARVIATSPIIVSNAMHITGGSVLTHPLSLETGLVIRAASLLLDTNSVIDVTARGYRGGQRDGNSNHHGLTTNETLGASVRAGGSYGGLGGQHTGMPNPVYGNATNPVHLGSGGSSNGGSTAGGSGGGRVDIWVPGTFTLEGTLRADGGAGGSTAGGGSGGSILIRAGTIEGAGQITSNGGAAQAGGGGGRIAIYYGVSSFDTNHVTASGGLGSTVSGSSGTVYFEMLAGGPGPFAAPIAGGSSSMGAPVILACDVCDQGHLHLQWDGGEAPQGWLIEFSPSLTGTNWIVVDGPVSNVNWNTSIGEGAPPAGFFRLRQP